MMRYPAALAVLVLGLVGAKASGQAVPAASQSAAQDGDTCPSFNANAPSAASDRCQSAQRGGDSLDGGRHYLFSLASLGGYDDAFNARQGLTATFLGGTAYGGFMSLKPSSFTMLENTASWIDYHVAEGTQQYLNSTGISLLRMMSSRTSFSFNDTNVFGNDAIRILPIAGNGNVEEASYGIHSGRVLDNQVTARLTQQRTASGWWAITVRNNFRDFIDDASSVNTMHARAEVQYQRSARSGIGIFEETSIENGAVSCQSQSVGLVYERRFSQTLATELAAAPAFGTKGCIDKVSANLYGAVSAQLWRSTNLYISAFRKLNDSAFSALTYENNVQGGWMQKIGLRTSLTAEAGWIGGTAPLHVQPFSGYYYSGTYGRSLPGGLNASVSYQQFNWSGVANAAPTRNILMGCLNWSPSRYTPGNLHGPTSH
jgi:hypothetical protein